MKNFLSLMAVTILMVISFSSCSKDDSVKTRHSITVVTVGEGTARADKSSAEPGETITLTATPAQGYELYAWNSAGGNLEFTPPLANEVTFVMPEEDVIVTTAFGPVRTYTVQLSTDGNGTAGADKPAALTGETVTITAMPSAGYVFKGWTVEEGNAEINDLTANPTTFVMPDGIVSIKAEFEEDQYDIFALATDENFAAYIKKSMTSPQTIDGQIYPAWDSNADGVLSSLEIAEVEAIEIASAGIKSLAGIEKFASLRYLNVRKNAINDIDLSHNTELVKLYLMSNAIESLDLAKNTKLEILDCSENPLPALEISANTNLRSLTVVDCPLIMLDITKNKRLTYLEASYTELSSLDVINNTELVTLIIDNNNFSSIDLSKNTRLSSFNCFSNNFSSIDLSHNKVLSSLTCSNNAFTELDLTNVTSLRYLNCGSNMNLTKLNVSGLANLGELITHQCNLTELDLSGCTGLWYLYCFSNHISTLDISKMTYNEAQSAALTLWVGNQTSVEGNPQSVTIKMRQDQVEWMDWNNGQSPFNSRVEYEVVEGTAE